MQSVSNKLAISNHHVRRVLSVKTSKHPHFNSHIHCPPTHTHHPWSNITSVLCAIKNGFARTTRENTTEYMYVTTTAHNCANVCLPVGMYVLVYRTVPYSPLHITDSTFYRFAFLTWFYANQRFLI